MRVTLAATLALLSPAAPATSATITSLVGDIDCFGSDKPVCETVSVNELNAATPDPGDGDTDLWARNSFHFVHIFGVPVGKPIVSATLDFATLDMEDAAGATTDTYDNLLFVDGIEIVGAFDDVFTGPAQAATQISINLTAFDLSPAILAALADGRADVRIDPRGGLQKDRFAVDYSRLTITVVPLPASALLLLAGIGALLRLRRRT